MLIGRREFTSRSRRFLEEGVQGVEKKKIVRRIREEWIIVAVAVRVDSLEQKNNL